MKAVNLGKHNEAIDWRRNDEIGDLVKEYNKMVAKLEDKCRCTGQKRKGRCMA
ncbi:MAG: methyl-accepting chemotaxis protein [Chitinophagaceae bacterium]|nr:methyl-accepting chemotaxis protein [Chitinophagaceae bacterium]